MYEKFAGYSNKEKELLYFWEEIVMEKANKYQLEDYFVALSTLKERYGDKYEVDIATNKIGQPSVRVQYKLSKARSYELFVFGFDFAVAYKPNGKTMCYTNLTPKQIIQMVKLSLDWWINKCSK